MLDRRGWKRSEWTMITKRRLHWYEIDHGFCGIVEMLEVSEPFKVGKDQLTICDAGITWVQCAWENVPLWATAMFDMSGNLFQIYFDVCDEVHLEGEESWFTDLIVDVVFDPDGTVSVLDEDELLDALMSKTIKKSQKEQALQMTKRLVDELNQHPKQVVEWFVELFQKSVKKPLK